MVSFLRELYSCVYQGLVHLIEAIVGRSMAKQPLEMIGDLLLCEIFAFAKLGDSMSALCTILYVLSAEQLMTFSDTDIKSH